MNYTKNYLGFTLSDEEMKDIPYPKMELTDHITMKTIQAFSLLGMGFAAPIKTALSGPRTLLSLRNTALRYGKGGAVVGLVAGPLMTYARMRNEGAEGWYDRCYRLRNNRGQVRVDRFWVIGALVGTGATYMTGGVLTAGAVIGANSGVLVAAAYNNMK